jgi:hypothetical protein
MVDLFIALIVDAVHISETSVYFEETKALYPRKLSSSYSSP